MDIKEILDPVWMDDDVKVSENIYLRINTNAAFLKDKIVYWFSKAIQDAMDQLKKTYLKDQTVCLSLDSIEFMLTDFQEEGLYCVMSEWLEKQYNIQIPQPEISFDAPSNKYIFKFQQ